MNTQTDGHTVIFRIHTGTYVYMLTRPHTCTLQLCLHVRTHSQPSLEIRSKKLEIRYVTDMFIDNRLTCIILTEDDKTNGRSDGRTNGKKTFKLTESQTISHKNMHTGGRTDTRTDGHIYR